MPDTLPTMMPGNWSQPPDFPTGQSVNMAGARYFEYNGYALVTDATGVSIDIKNENDEVLTIPCAKDGIALSAADPAYVTHVSFYVPKIGDAQSYNQKAIVANVTISGTQVLKLSVAATDDLTSATVIGAVTGAATSGVVPNGVTAGEAISLWAPNTAPIVVTAATTLKLFSATLASGGVAGANIRVSTAQKRVFIPVRVHYYRKQRAPGLGDFDISATVRQTIDALP